VWRIAVGGGEEIRITGGVCAQFFAVVKSGVYFFSGWDNPSVQLYDFANRKIEAVAKVEGNMEAGFSLSPDSRWLLYAAWEDGVVKTDLMMVENFR